MKNNWFRGATIFLVLLTVIYLMASLSGSLGGSVGEKKDIRLDEFLSNVEQENIQRVAIYNDEYNMVGVYKDTKVDLNKFPKDYDFQVAIPKDGVLQDEINGRVARKLGVNKDTVTTADWGFDVEYVTPPRESIWSVILPNLIVVVLFGGIIFLFMRQMQGSNNKAMSFGRSRAKLADDTARKKTFADVAGADEEKEELVEVVDFLKNPKRFLDLGARIPKGVLLVGPPGTGKTLLARAVAGEAGVPFFAISGSDFVELYVGVGASRVRDLFDRAKRNSPCIVFIDEIDAVGRQRGAGMGGGHDEREQTLNQMLVEMDGFNTNEGIIILAATNRADILDPALLRPGRFDRQITVHYPDVKGREEILKVHSKGKPLAPNVDLGAVARMTSWFTGADLENVMNEAAILTARRGGTVIDMTYITEAINRVHLGPEKKSRKVIEKDRKLVACHEAGHAIAAKLLPNCDPVHEVSIIPRGLAGGYTQTLPKEDEQFVSRNKLLDDLAMMLAGQVAEKVMLGDISTGATSDLKRASDVARRMITEYGMSDEIGPVYLGGGQEVFLGRDYGHTHNYSEKLSSSIDSEIKRTLVNAEQRAENLIRTHLDKLQLLIDTLLTKEKIDGEEFDALMA